MRFINADMAEEEVFLRFIEKVREGGGAVLTTAAPSLCVSKDT